MHPAAMFAMLCCAFVAVGAAPLRAFEGTADVAALTSPHLSDSLAESRRFRPGTGSGSGRDLLQAGAYGDAGGFQGFNFGTGRLQLPLPLPATLERTLIDPTKGYAIIELEPGVHFVTEGVYNILVIVGDGGVVVIDAPPTMAAFILPAVREVTDAPVTHFVYSHMHVDHAAAAGPLFGGGNVTIVGGAAAAAALAEVADPARPVPSLVVASGGTVDLAGVSFEFIELPYSHDRSTTLIRLPASGVVMLVDITYPGWVPFRAFGITSDMRAYIDAHGVLLGLKWTHLAAGHLSRPGTRADVRVALEYLDDAQRFVREGLARADNAAIVGAIPERFRDNPWAVFSEVQGSVITLCYERIVAAWAGRLAGVDVFSWSSCTKVLEYVAVDEGL